MTTLAQIAGPVGCAGLAVLLVATRRDLRIAGLAAWALGLGGLALYLAPDVSPSAPRRGRRRRSRRRPSSARGS